MSSTASVEIEAVRASWAERVNDALELAQVAERVDHRSYARQGMETEPTVKMGHDSSAIERRAQREQEAAGEELQAVTPRGQMNEAILETRSLGIYVERGREWLREMGGRLRQGSELAARSMAGMVPAIEGQSPQRERTPGQEIGGQAQQERDRQRERQQELERQRGRDGPDIGFGR